MNDVSIHPASFKDPAGFIFTLNGKIYRRVNFSYAVHYDQLISSGLYKILTGKNWLLQHTESDEDTLTSRDVYKVLLPQQLSFISYPYEWSFDMLKDAALLTLNIALEAIESGMILKDASPYNIQFLNGKPVFIDTLSFEIHNQSKPWIAYRQFCETFLFPLYLEYYLNVDFKKFLSTHLDGIPVDVTARLLPLRSRLNLGVWLHVYLQNSVKGNGREKTRHETFSKTKITRLLQHLYGIIEGLTCKRFTPSAWSQYYKKDILSRDYLVSKEKIIREFISGIQYEQVLDIGSNDGYFSRIVSERALEVLCIDTDSHCINRLYNEVKTETKANLLPLVVDISNPSPAIGFNNHERTSFIDRVHADLVVALALIHHLVISNNIPLHLIAGLFAKTAPLLIVEFIPKDDERAKEMIGERAALFEHFTRDYFEQVFFQYYQPVKREEVPGSHRTLYLLRRND